MGTPEDVFSVAAHTPVLYIVAIGAALWVISCGINLRQRFRLRHIPGPRPAWWFRNSREVIRSPVLRLHNWAQKYGGCYRFYKGTTPQVVISDPDLVKSVTVKQFMHFHDRPPATGTLDGAFNREFVSLRVDGVGVARGKFWAGLRATLNSMFLTSSLQSFVPLMNQVAGGLVDGLCAAGNGSQVNICALLRGMALDVVGTTAFGVKFDALQPPGHPVSELVHHCMGAAAPRSYTSSKIRMLCTFIPEFSWLWVYYVKLLDHLPFRGTQIRGILRHCASAGYLWGVAEAMLHAVRGEKGGLTTCNGASQHCSSTEDPPLSYEPTEQEYHMGLMDVTYQYKRKALAKYAGMVPLENTLMYHLASAVNKDTRQPLTDAQICAQSNFILLAGSETTWVALTYTLYEVARHPEVQRKVVEEVDRVLGKSGEAGHAQLSDLPYLVAVFQEAMRKHPVVAVMYRQCSADVRVGDFLIPSGCTVLLNAYSMHYDPRNFPQPEVFRPERFLPDSEEAKTRHPYAYMPFGFGPRKCMGYNFFMQEATLTLAKIFQQVTFSLPADAPPLEYTDKSASRPPKHDVKLVVHHRTLE